MNDVSVLLAEESVALKQLLWLAREGEAQAHPDRHRSAGASQAEGKVAFADRSRNTALRVDAILSEAHVDSSTRICALLGICPELSSAKGPDQLTKQFGVEVSTLVGNLARVGALPARISNHGASSKADAQVHLSLELLRRMLLAMAEDIRVVIVFLSIRLDLLRQFALGVEPINIDLCQETRKVLVPLANRLGLGFLKWELEDLSFRFLEPREYKSLASALDEKRAKREKFIDEAVATLQHELESRCLKALVYGRPKHLSSIAQKLRLKRLTMDEIHDLRALRVVVSSVQECYLVLDVVNSLWRARSDEFDDYIAKPKGNGYQSIHCVMIAQDGRSLEVQIRTEEMHRFAEFGVASHWRYKEKGGTPPAKGSSAASHSSHEAQLNWMRQLLAWQQDLALSIEASDQFGTDQGEDTNQVLPSGEGAHGQLRSQRPEMPQKAQDRVYVLTPQARIIELPAGATPLDFAYHLHSGLGHRCRGAKVNGTLVPLSRALHHGETVEILLAPKNQFDAGPSRDWLGHDPIYLVSARSKAKVRQWFAAQQAHAQGAPASSDSTLRAEEKNDLKTDQQSKDKERTAHEELSSAAIGIVRRAPVADTGILVVGVDALMTRLARCCRPIPPDEITGYVSLGKGVTVHRSQCSSLTRLVGEKTERLIATSWGEWEKYRNERRYPVDIELTARDRPYLLRDVSEVFAKGKWPVLAMKTLSRKDNTNMRFTVEVAGLSALREALGQLAQVAGVESARRRADLGRKARQTDSTVSR
jgi:GTP pyrophosphokinase